MHHQLGAGTFMRMDVYAHGCLCASTLGTSGEIFFEKKFFSKI